MAFQACAKRCNATSRQNQPNSQIKKSSSQRSDGQSWRQVSDVHSPNGQNSCVQRGTKASLVKSPAASPIASTSSAKASPVKSPVANTKASTSLADELKYSSKQNTSSVVNEKKPLTKSPVELKSDSEDSEDGKRLSARVPAGLSKGNSNYAKKGPSITTLGSSLSPNSKVSVKKLSEDLDDEIPSSSRFQLKSCAGASASKSCDSHERKPLASKLQQNGSTMKGNQLGKSPTVSNKRPLGEVGSSDQSSVKKPKLADACTPIKVKQVSMKAEPKVEDDDHVSMAKRMKKSNDKSTSTKQKVTKVVSSSFKKTTMKSKTAMKNSKYLKSGKLPPASVEGQKWTTLFHNGVIFPPPYKPHGVKMLYDGQPVDLTPEQEEVATMFAVMIDTDYASKDRFKENFMNDWRKLLGKNHVIKEFGRCNFAPIYEWHQKEKAKEKQMSTEEKKATDEEKRKQVEKHTWAIVDGIRERVVNFIVEPPGLFRGHGEHPKMGKLKRRIRPSDITINIGKDAPIPECPVPGESWKYVKHDNTVTWLAFWNDPIDPKEFKYVFLSYSSSLKGQSGKEKYKKARMLKSFIHGIRATYTRDFVSEDITKRQIAVTTYLIDKLALMAGNEKDDDEADIVGSSTLKVENVNPRPSNKLEVPIICNHQHSVSKSHTAQMSRLTEKINELKVREEDSSNQC